MRNLLVKTILTNVFCFFMAGFALAQNAGKVIEHNVVKSSILNKEVPYAIYLPADYENSERTYPVVYLLHGYGDNYASWIQFGEVNRYADKAIAEGTIPPMIIVMPEGDTSWYINAYNGKYNYEDFFVKEFIPSIEKTWRIKSQKKYRGIAGLSMGGYGTLIYSLKYPELFAAAAPLSSGVFTDDQIAAMNDDRWERRQGHLFGHGLKGKDRLNNSWYNNSVLKLVENNSTEDLSKVRYWIDCGDDDFLTKGNCLLHLALVDKNVPHEFRVRNGAHSWSYWRSGITDALQFIGQSFHQE
jgi:S-formylglutathione hydrolase FrmB